MPKMVCHFRFKISWRWGGETAAIRPNLLIWLTLRFEEAAPSTASADCMVRSAARSSRTCFRGGQKSKFLSHTLQTAYTCLRGTPPNRIGYGKPRAEKDAGRKRC